MAIVAEPEEDDIEFRPSRSLGARQRAKPLFILACRLVHVFCFTFDPVDVARVDSQWNE